MVVNGTVRMSARLDYDLSQVFNGDYNDLKENIKILLRLGTYQLYYMDNIPDYAAVATTVQMAKKIHTNLGNLANALLRSLIKKNITYKFNSSTPIEELSKILSHPIWLLEKWIKDKNYTTNLRK